MNWSPEKKEALRIMCDNGATREELEAVFGSNWEGIRKAMRRHNIRWKSPPDFDIEKFNKIMEEKSWKPQAQE